MGAAGMTMLSTLSSATSVLQKVATHVVGADDPHAHAAAPGGAPPAAAAAKQQQQVEMLKQQLIESAKENDMLARENEQLGAKLAALMAGRQGEADMLAALQGKVALLQQELGAEQAARRQAEQALRQVRVWGCVWGVGTGCSAASFAPAEDQNR